jgi:hypothetical protein
MEAWGKGGTTNKRNKVEACYQDMGRSRALADGAGKTE